MGKGIDQGQEFIGSLELDLNKEVKCMPNFKLVTPTESNATHRMLTVNLHLSTQLAQVINKDEGCLSRPSLLINNAHYESPV